MTVEEKREFDRELEELCRLQREGAFGPILDTGKFVPFSFVAELLKPETQTGEWVN
jgi:hypothetical protein